MLLWAGYGPVVWPVDLRVCVKREGLTASITKIGCGQYPATSECVGPVDTLFPRFDHANNNGEYIWTAVVACPCLTTVVFLMDGKAARLSLDPAPVHSNNRQRTTRLTSSSNSKYTIMRYLVWHSQQFHPKYVNQSHSLCVQVCPLCSPIMMVNHAAF